MSIDPLAALMAAVLAAGVVSLSLWPDRGLFWRWRRERQLTERVLIEDALKLVHDEQEAGRSPTAESVARALNTAGSRAAALLEQMAARQLLSREPEGYRLTGQGRDYALQIIRAHRLWERYLADETGYVDREWHGQAHRREHHLSPAQVEDLSRQLNHPTHDPHGDPIPTAGGDLPPHESQPLTGLGVGTPARIVHLEDEPPALYEQLVAQGLHPGMEVRVIETDPRRVRVWTGDAEHVLAPEVAANVWVAPLVPAPIAAASTATGRLAELRPGEQAQVTGIAPACRGAERRRFLDLGILPGTVVEAAVASPSGNPTAYRVRGALIALRRDQASHIEIARTQEVA